MIPACPDCGGTGRRAMRWTGVRWEWPRQRLCPACDGTGRLSLAVLPRKHVAEPRLRSVFSPTTEAAV